MRAGTVLQLNRINRDFYARCHDDFSATRQRPWPGWWRVLQLFHDCERPSGGDSILDVGCGNGRFARAVAERSDARYSYLGIDASLPLLRAALAGGHQGDRHRFVTADFLAGELPIAAPRRFGLAVAFGVLHHVPSRQRRVQLLRDLGALLAPDGLLAVTCWQFGAFDRFRRRIVPWEEYNRTAVEPVDLADLDRGDHLLAWGDGEFYRYCHHTDPEEAEELVVASGLRVVERFFDDGESRRLNIYFVCATG